jgi:predicted cupin superfamily sugar epimerase
MRSAAYWIERLRLTPHPEGGHFQEVYRASESVDVAALPARFTGARPFSTSIYFLLEQAQRAALHRIRSDEVWHFYDGFPLTLFVIDEAGTLSMTRLGRDPDAGETLQAVVPAGCWFGASVDAPGAYALVGCTVAPGFDFADFELAERSDLLRRYPQHRDVIEHLTC